MCGLKVNERKEEVFGAGYRYFMRVGLGSIPRVALPLNRMIDAFQKNSYLSTRLVFCWFSCDETFHQVLEVL